MRIDVHTHALSPKIATKVLGQLQEHYGITPIGDGLVEDLLRQADMAGLDRVVVHSAATAPAQVIPANNWAIELEREHPRVTAFGTLHPQYEDWESELERLKRHGIRGIKLHPEFQGFWLDDPALHPLIEAAQDDFAFMVHIGDALPPEKNPSCPYKLANLMDLFPSATFIAAHLGGYLHWEHALETIIGRDVYIDTSSSLPYMEQTTLEEIFRRHSRERILFGSDYPLFSPATELGLLEQRLSLRESELEDLMSNAEALPCFSK